MPLKNTSGFNAFALMTKQNYKDDYNIYRINIYKGGLKDS